jgi:serine/threonine protein kinase
MATKKEMMLAVKAVQAKMCDQKQVQKSLDIQRAYKKEKGEDIPLLTIMKKKGYLSDDQIKALALSVPKISTIRLEDNPIAGYQLVEKIGQGGMAAVFYAEGDKVRDGCALKILFPHHNSNQEYVNGFVNEAKLVCEMNHPNLVKGLDYGISNNHYFLAMEYVPGSLSVKDVLDKHGAFEEDAALHIILQIAKALVYISDYGILHRDIKPDNTLITNDGTVKVCDLGFAKTIEKNAGKKSGLTCGNRRKVKGMLMYEATSIHWAPHFITWLSERFLSVVPIPWRSWQNRFLKV